MNLNNILQFQIILVPHPIPEDNLMIKNHLSKSLYQMYPCRQCNAEAYGMF